jgi:hypothetical protein
LTLKDVLASSAISLVALGVKVVRVALVTPSNIRSKSVPFGTDGTEYENVKSGAFSLSRSGKPEILKALMPPMLDTSKPWTVNSGKIGFLLLSTPEEGNSTEKDEELMVEEAKLFPPVWAMLQLLVPPGAVWKFSPVVPNSTPVSPKGLSIASNPIVAAHASVPQSIAARAMSIAYLFILALLQEQSCHETVKTPVAGQTASSHNP